MNIVILAAGQGKRMCSSLPKVLHCLSGKPMLERILESIFFTKVCKNIVVVIGHSGELIERYLQSSFPTVKIAVQKEQKGTGHALQQAIPYLDQNLEKTLILYGDVPLLQPNTILKLDNLKHKQGIILLTETLDNPMGYGRIIRNKNFEIERIVEENDAPNSIKIIKEINTGIMLLPTSFLDTWLNNLDCNNAQKEYYLTDIIHMAIKNKISVLGIKPHYSWEIKGVNNREQLLELEKIWQLHLTTTLVNSGVSLQDPQRTDIRGHLECDKDVWIDIGCIFHGNVKIGNNVKIGPYCVIKDTVIQEGAIIEAFSYIENSYIGIDAKIGPYARLRSNTKIGQKVKIGNFVEIKNSTILENSKAGHLTYLGDAKIGKNVNIGAGTITCNYDGIRKHVTIIEDESFIGSGTQLIAPIKVGRNATLGAGTTLTKDAPENQLTITRAQQVSLNWKKSIK